MQNSPLVSISLFCSQCFNYLCYMIKGTYHQYRGPDLFSLDIFSVELNPSAEQESWTRSEDHQAGLGQVGGQQSLISCVTSPRSTFQEPKR